MCSKTKTASSIDMFHLLQRGIDGERALRTYVVLDAHRRVLYLGYNPTCAGSETVSIAAGPMHGFTWLAFAHAHAPGRCLDFMQR
jgi:hypothetical protein